MPEADARAELNRRLKKTKTRLAEVDRILERHGARRYDELMELMASEELLRRSGGKFNAALDGYITVSRRRFPRSRMNGSSFSTKIEEETARGLA